MQKKVVIELREVTKKYIIHHEKPTLIENIFNKQSEEFYALKNVNLTIHKGDRVGLIGPNGSGKTTLLKIMAGISSPTLGSAKSYGKTVSLIDLGAGFNPDLTGLQNIYLNGMIIGMNKSEIEDKMSKIIDNANIGHFINAPIFTYSDGMRLRLGFSIAINSNPDILILDENIAVGDEDFKTKSKQIILNLASSGTTLVFSSHYLDLVWSMCNKVHWLNKGSIYKSGSPKKLLEQYVKNNERMNAK